MFSPLPDPLQKASVIAVTCFLSFPLLPQYWRACPSQPALLNVAHGSSVMPTSVTTPTASPSPLIAKVVQVSLVRLLTTVHAAWCLSPPNPKLYHYSDCELTWAVIGCLCFTWEDSYQASNDRSQPNLFAWHIAIKISHTEWQHILFVQKYVDTHGPFRHDCEVIKSDSCMTFVKGLEL